MSLTNSDCREASRNDFRLGIMPPLGPGLQCSEKLAPNNGRRSPQLCVHKLVFFAGFAIGRFRRLAVVPQGGGMSTPPALMLFIAIRTASFLSMPGFARATATRSRFNCARCGLGAWFPPRNDCLANNFPRGFHGNAGLYQSVLSKSPVIRIAVQQKHPHMFRKNSRMRDSLGCGAPSMLWGCSLNSIQ